MLPAYHYLRDRLFQSRCQDSANWNQRGALHLHLIYVWFQSRCQDSANWNVPFLLLLRENQKFQSRCQDSANWNLQAWYVANGTLEMFQSRCQDSANWNIRNVVNSWAITVLFQSRCQDSANWNLEPKEIHQRIASFSPVARILLIETDHRKDD